MNSETALTSQVPIVHPLRVIETPVDGVSVHGSPPSNNLDGTMRLH
jgi:hypothetical protein